MTNIPRPTPGADPGVATPPPEHFGPTLLLTPGVTGHVLETSWHGGVDGVYYFKTANRKRIAASLAKHGYLVIGDNVYCVRPILKPLPKVAADASFGDLCTAFFIYQEEYERVQALMNDDDLLSGLVYHECNALWDAHDDIFDRISGSEPSDIEELRSKARVLSTWLKRKRPAPFEEHADDCELLAMRLAKDIERMLPNSCTGIDAELIAAVLKEERRVQAPGKNPTPRPSGDAILIAACHMAETAHHAVMAACFVVSDLDTRTPEGAAANAVYLQRTDTLWGQIQALCEIRPQTPEGHAAMARLVVVIANDYGPLEGGEEEEEDISFDFVPKPLIRTIIENLAGAVA